MVSNIQRFSIHDGPGIRTTVFFQGLPPAVRLVRQPRDPAAADRALIQRARLQAFATPVSPSALNAPYPYEATAAIRIDRQTCTLCGACVRACNYQALYFEGRSYMVEELLAEVLKDRPFYEKSSGGVTISGGEPFFQPAFLLELLKALKGVGVHTAVETTGFAPEDAFLGALPYIDLLLYDFKHPDSTLHRQGTGVGNERILSNLSSAFAAWRGCDRPHSRDTGL